MKKNFINHVELSHRKAICAKVIFFKWISDYQADLARTNSEGPTVITDWWIGRCNNELVEVRNDVTLSDFLRSLIDDFEAEYNHFFPEEQSTDFFDYLKSRIQEIDCQECSPRICNGSIENDIASADGHCLDHFRKLFYWVAIITREKYTKYSSIFPKKSVPDLIFCTNSRITKPHGLNIPVFIGSMLEFVDHPPNGISKIILVFNADNLSRKCLYPVPYMLFHECIAHAYKSIVGPKGYKRGKDFPLEHEPYNPFDEGWMDYVAYKIALKVLDEISKEKRDCPDTIDAKVIDEYITATYNFHSAREAQQGYVATQERGNYWNRYKGFEAAKRFERFLKKFPATKDHYRKYFLRTSFDFNLWALNNKQKEKFPEIVYDLLSAQSTEENPSPEQIDRLRYFTGAFRRYIEGVPINKFFQELEKIKY